MSTEKANEIDQPLAALTKLRDALTPHGIQITNIKSVHNKDVLGGDMDEICVLVDLYIPIPKAGRQKSG
jgi:hypothetical protein